MKKTGWGIIGPGGIAHRFLNDLPRCRQADLAAVASRSYDRARIFADQYHFRKSYGSYDEILSDPAVDIIYIATPHPQHHDLAIRCLKAGKAVLCEKPAAVHAAQIREMIDCARQNNVFFMEAMWTRFFPVNQRVKALIDSGALGAVTLIEADFGFGRWNAGKVDHPENRLYSLDLAGGSLLDVGVYCVSYATWLKGEKPAAVKALATKLETGVDGMTACLFQYADGTMAVLRSSISRTTRQTAMIYCEKATIEVPDFWHPAKAIIQYADSKRPPETIEDDYTRDGSTGYHYEAEAVMSCLAEGAVQCPVMDWQQSIEVIELLDQIREETGLRYPSDCP